MKEPSVSEAREARETAQRAVDEHHIILDNANEDRARADAALANAIASKDQERIQVARDNQKRAKDAVEQAHSYISVAKERLAGATEAFDRAKAR